MKNFFKAYSSFTRREKMGVTALLLLLLILIGIRVTMQLWVKPEMNIAQQEKIVKAWEKFKAEQNTPVAAVAVKDTVTTQPQSTIAPTYKVAKHDTKLFSFDPNTIDSTGLRKLGLKEKTTSIFLHWRSKGKVFHKKEELKKLYTLTEQEYNRLEPYIAINGLK